MGTPGDKAKIGEVVPADLQPKLESEQQTFAISPSALPLQHTLLSTSTSTEMGVIERLPQFETFIHPSLPHSAAAKQEAYHQPHTITKPEAYQEIMPEQPTIEDYFAQTKFYPSVSDYPLPVYHPNLPSKPKTFLSSIEQPGPSGLQTPKTKPSMGVVKPKKTRKPDSEQTTPQMKKYSCHFCPKNFASQEKLNKHQQTHIGTSPFKCENCKKSFTSKFKLVRHALIHSDRKPFSCSVCDRTFHRKDHLKNHIKVHSPQKEVFICEKEGCKKQYTSLLSYRKHQAVHAAEEGNLICQICSDSFETKEDIIYHLKIHAGSRTVKNPNEKKFTCEFCERKFFTKKDVRRHLVVHTGMRDFLCQYCPQRFGRKDHLVRHIKKSHNTKYKPEETITTAPIKTEQDATKFENVPQLSDIKIKSELSESSLSNQETFNPELDFSLKTIFEDDFPPFLEQEDNDLFLPSTSEQGELKDLGSEILEDIEGPTASSDMLIVGDALEASQSVLEEVVLSNPELLHRLLETPGDKNLPLPGFSQTFQPPQPPGPQQ